MSDPLGDAHSREVLRLAAAEAERFWKGWISSPLGSRVERVALSWLKSLFELPAGWGGVLTSGATMANFTGLAAARRWWAGEHGVDVDERGGFAFVRDPALMHGTFALTGAPYLPEVSAERPSYGDRGPEASRRARALAVRATLKAYGRAGYRAMVDRQDDADLIARVTSELGGRLPAAT